MTGFAHQTVLRREAAQLLLAGPGKVILDGTLGGGGHAQALLDAGARVVGIDYAVGRAAAEAGRIILDLREVTHLDYAGVPELVARRRELLARGGDLLIAVRNPYVSNILKAAGGAELVLFRSVEEAASPMAKAMAAAPRARAMRK